MNFFKKNIILLTPNADKYAELILNNCLHDCHKKNKDFNSIDIIFQDPELVNILYNLILYGNLISKTNKKINTYSQIGSFDIDNEHLMSIEIEKFQRIHFFLDKILIFTLILSILTIILYLA